MSAAAQRRLRELDPGVSRETLGRLETMVETLLRWQGAINLVGRATLDNVWVRHVLDSAQLAPLIPKGVTSLVDLGSGAGFPGLLPAVLRPELDVVLIESDASKCADICDAAL